MTYLDRLKPEYLHWRRKMWDGYGFTRNHPCRMFRKIERYKTRAKYNRAKGTNHNDTVKA